MLSSSFKDLADQREQIRQLMRRYDLHEIVMENDAALPALDKIDASLLKVARADAYLCVIGYRYGTRERCKKRNPDNLSLTELEWRRARERDIPRCTLMMSPQYTGLRLGDVEAVSAADRRSIAAFRKLAESDRVFASFANETDFQLKVMQSLEQLHRDLEALVATAVRVPVAPQPQPLPQSSSVDLYSKQPVAAPALHFVRKPYIEKRHFVGREQELAWIDAWATSKQALLLFQAIGGMGKSALTWHWLKHRASLARPDLAGRLWYSFYEEGADLEDFCVHALAYIRGLPPNAFRDCNVIDLGNELRRELDARPWLLVLDGLERVLVAYNRLGKEHMSDEDALVAIDGLSLDRNPRTCFRPEDDRILAMLSQATCGKLLASSRLMPTALVNEERSVIPGVNAITLEGLMPGDAELMLRTAGVRGNRWRMRQFLRDNFACHPLSVGVVAGQVMTFLEARGDFDTWVDWLKGGAEPELIAKNLRGRQNHILARALDGLDSEERVLAGAIAMTNIELSMDMVRLINPKRPIEPRRTGSSAYADEMAYRTAHRLWQGKAREADEWLHRVLPKLETLDLVRYDAGSQSFDMHPAVRYTAISVLSQVSKNSTGLHVSDALSSRPLAPLAKARTVEELGLATTRVRALITAEHFGAAWQLLMSGLGDSLMRLERQDVLAELLQAYFPEGWEQPPRPIGLDGKKKVDPLTWASEALTYNHSIRRKLDEKVLEFDLGLSDVELVSRSLCGYTVLETDPLPVFSRFRLLTLAERLANLSRNAESLCRVRLLFIQYYLLRGNLSQADSYLNASRNLVKSPLVSDSQRAMLACQEVAVARRQGCLTVDRVDRARNLIRSLGQVEWERMLLDEVAGWQRECGAYEESLTTYSELIALTNSTTAREMVTIYQGRRAMSLIMLGHTDEAWSIVRQVEKEMKEPNALSARHYLTLGDNRKALEHALGVYPVAWGDGPPFHYHAVLKECREVLVAVGEPEPVLPPFDSSKAIPFDFEAAVERLIEKVRSD